MDLTHKLILNFTPTGMIPTKAMTPHVPVSVSEIVEQVHAACEIGITLAHLHARDEQTGAPTYRKSVYRDIIEGIRKHCPELVICLSLSGRDFNEFDKRSEAIELRPDMGSLTLSSLNFPRQASVNAPDMIQALAQKMTDFGVHPELEVFDLGMIHYAHYLIKKEIIGPPYYVNIILGNLAGMQTDLTEVGLAVKQLPADSWWALGGIGRQQLQANAIAIGRRGRGTRRPGGQPVFRSRQKCAGAKLRTAETHPSTRPNLRTSGHDAGRVWRLGILQRHAAD